MLDGYEVESFRKNHSIRELIHLSKFQHFLARNSLFKKGFKKLNIFQTFLLFGIYLKHLKISTCMEIPVKSKEISKYIYQKPKQNMLRFRRIL